MKRIKSFNRHQRVSALGVILLFSCSCVLNAQNWKATTAFPGTGAGTALLLTDGTLMVHDSCTPNWFKLTPDNTGNYLSGTWSAAIPMQSTFGPLFFASAVLADGRLVATGGEYNLTSCAANNSVDSNLAAIYTPATNSWTALPSPPFTNIGDAQSVVLPNNGKFLIGILNSKQIAQLDPATLTWTSFTPTGKADANSEEGWNLLPSGNILTVDTGTQGGTNSELYNPATTTWSSAGSTIVSLANNGGVTPPIVPEIGPAILRPDGTVFATGATGHNSVYTISTGTWAAAVDFPVIGAQQVIADGPAALLPNGNVLVVTSAFFAKPAHFFEFDGTNVNPEPATPNAPNIASFQGRMLLLPTGQVLFTDGSTDVEVYSPIGTFKPAWQPVISSVPAFIARGATYAISGLQFNGLSQANAYGDDAQSATNYPLVRITNNGTSHVFYSRTHDHSTMAVATGALTVSTNFDVPATLELGASTLVVVANGIPSQPISITVLAAADATTLTYTGAITGDYNDVVTLSAKLTTTLGGIAINGATVQFTNTFGGGSCSGVTNAAGIASCNVTPTVAAGTGYAVTATFAGDASFAESTTTAGFTVTLEESKLAITGPLSTPLNTPVTVQAQLTDPDGGAGIVGKTVTFDLGSGVGHPTCSSTTGAGGFVSCSLTPNEPAGQYTLSATFTDGVFYQSASTSVVFTVVAPPSISKAFGALAIPVGGDASLTFTIVNPNSATALTGVGFSDVLPSGLVVDTPNGVTGSCGGGVIGAVPASTTVSLSGATIAAGATCTFSVNVRSIAEGHQLNSVTVTSINGGTGNTALASIVSGNTLSLNYAANLNVGDSFVDFTSPGSDVVAGVSQNICINLYTFDPAEELIGCCSCSVTPNGLQTLSVLKSLISNPLTPAVPTGVVMKAVATAGAACNPSIISADALAFGLKAWRATLHQNTSIATSTFSPTETPFAGATLTSSDLAHITSTCGFIQSNGSGFGICRGCAAGGLGAAGSVQ